MYRTLALSRPPGAVYFFYGFAKKSFCCLCGMICRRAFGLGFLFGWSGVSRDIQPDGWAHCVMNQARNERITMRHYLFLIPRSVFIAIVYEIRNGFFFCLKKSSQFYGWCIISGFKINVFRE